MLLLLKKFFPNGGYVFVFREGKNGSCQFAQLDVELIFSEPFKNFLTKHIARDVIAFFPLIYRNAGEILVLLLSIELAQSHSLLSHS